MMHTFNIQLLLRMVGFEMDCDKGLGEPEGCQHVGEYISEWKHEHWSVYVNISLQYSTILLQASLEIIPRDLRKYSHTTVKSGNMHLLALIWRDSIVSNSYRSTLEFIFWSFWMFVWLSVLCSIWKRSKPRWRQSNQLLWHGLWT